DLRNNGHGSQAVIVTQDNNGRAHAWNVVNHNGKITYVDAQTGKTSNKPLHDGTNGVHAIPLNADRRPTTPTPTPNDHHPGDTRPKPPRRPAAEPAGGNKHKHPDDMDIDGDDGHDNKKPKLDSDAMDVDETSSTSQYSHPHDRGDSDTSAQETGEKSVFEREGEKSKEYGLEPDALQQALRAQQPVHRVRLDNVHDHLNQWADDGSLARALRTAAGDAHPSEQNAGSDPLRFNKDDLIKHLPGFDKMEHGEQIAVISTMARLSLSFHEQHGVGNNPRHIEKPYLGEGKPAPTPGTRDSAAKNADGSLGVKGHKASGEKYLSDIPEADEAQTNDIWKHSPDFTDRNYAVLEVKDPDGKITFVVDSSVPTGEKYVSGRHSEKHLIEWLKRSNEGLPAGKSYTAQSLYTEREPCGKGQGHAKCSDELRKHLKGLPIYYSTTYRTDPEGVAARKALDGQKRAVIKAIPSLSDAEVRAEVTRRVTERYGENSGRTANHLKELADADAAGAREKLKKVIDSDYKKLKEEERTEKEHAIVREMERHVDALEETWHKVYPQLVS
ncbi:toxin glutamine deamidase domain-containing protein, partial [Streptomyces sp. NRRL S-337]|uniref:toxin glutamine deamidase domain-containing protein n=1 Tax=Streptomyces sp. NRRL S-337 TaxID=1463900 RepID=UPI00055B1823